MAAPMDFNIPYCEKSVLMEKIKMAHKLGYEGVAINFMLPEKALFGGGKKKKKQADEETLIIPPENLKLSEEELKSLIGPTRKPFKQLSRITAVLTDAANNYGFGTDPIQNYDLIAVKPTSDKTFHQACYKLNVDLITIDVTEKLNYKIKRTTINAAAQRGIKFEIQYAPAIRDSTLRRYFIANAQQLVFLDKGKNVLLTSGCERAMELRGPYDVANLGILLNLNEAQAKDAITANCRALLAHCESRRLYKSVSKVEKLSDVPKEDAWLLEKVKIYKPDDKHHASNLDTASGIHGDRSSDECSDSEPAVKKMKVENT
ncbi:ribonuclease P protein subunit p30-like [Mya arenaria]|uniref:ribonuclease P protein subunit p30-like n=1 Tax=Mya arenaria TaxID=6604 RepID=UPI0022E96F1E|nr:ribonuclease P protein subunit p30-like [Mya arenaria]